MSTILYMQKMRNVNKFEWFLFVGHKRGRQIGKCSNVNLAPTRVRQGLWKCSFRINHLTTNVVQFVYFLTIACRENIYSFNIFLISILVYAGFCLWNMFSCTLYKRPAQFIDLVCFFCSLAFTTVTSCGHMFFSLHHNPLIHFHREKLLVKPMKKCTSGTRLYLPTKWLN